MNSIKEEIKTIGIKGYRLWLMLSTISLAIVETVILLSINAKIKRYFSNVDLCIVAIPILITLLISWGSRRSLFKIYNNDYLKRLQCVKNSFVVTSFIYMIAILINFNVRGRNSKIIIFFVCFSIIYLAFMLINEKAYLKENTSLNPKKKNESKLFNTYYINISKVFEIAMLINNKVAISIENEKIVENNESFNENLSTNINIEYLNSVKNGISFQETYTKSNSAKNKVLENFEVKTTKSNLLDTIIKKSKEYKPNEDLMPGDLLLFNNVEIELINEEETMQTTKMLLNGAFNGSNFSSTTNDIKMDLNMSSLMNSMLKDCSYELKCSVNDFVFYIKIPMSFDNDFENSYNIYDILIGKMTLIGIYSGKDSKKKYKSAFEFFANSQNKNDLAHSSGLKKSVMCNENYKNREVALDEINEGKSDYVDIIAIIKEINIDVNENEVVRNE